MVAQVRLALYVRGNARHVVVLEKAQLVVVLWVDVLLEVEKVEVAREGNLSLEVAHEGLLDVVLVLHVKGLEGL